MRVALFRSDVTNEIHLDPFTTGVGNTNLPPSRRRASSSTASWQVSKTFRLSAGYAYTEAKFLEGTLPGGPLRHRHQHSDRRQDACRWCRSTSSTSRSPGTLRRARGFPAPLTAVSEQYRDNDEPNTLSQIPGYQIVDLKLAQRFSWGRLSLAVNNLFNQDYYTYSARSAVHAFPDRYSVYPLPGTTVSLTAEVFTALVNSRDGEGRRPAGGMRARAGAEAAAPRRRAACGAGAVAC